MKIPSLARLLALGLCATMGCAESRAALDVVHEFDLAAIARAQPEVASLQPDPLTGKMVLCFAPQRPGQTLLIWDGQPAIDWKAAQHLVCEGFHTNRASAILNFDFYRRGRSERDGLSQQGAEPASSRNRGPRISPKIGVLPELPTQVIFPLVYLNGQEIFLWRFPRQLKGTVSGHRLERDEVGVLRVRLSPVDPPEWLSTLFIRRLYLTREVPPPLPRLETPYVDRFGQWARRDWPGKVHDETELRRQLEGLKRRTAGASYPEGWSRFGGWKAKRFEATGFFRTHHDGRRWWLVDPEGYAFVSVGMDCVGPSAYGVTQGQEDLFEWLPSREGPFAEAVSRRGVDFLRANLIRVFGADWRKEWERITAGLLRQIGFNTIGNWSDIAFARRARVPYVLPMRGFPDARVRLFRDFPDVFSEDYKQAARRFARQLEEYKDDPYLIGYFLRNEPQWAFGRNNLAFEMFATPQDSASKREFIRWIRERYQGDLARFNRAWRLDLQDFDQLRQKTFRDAPSPTAEKDFWEFSKVLAARYVDVPCDAVKAVDPHHLNLGMRYAWMSSELLYAAGQRFDVFSINGYSFPGPPPTEEIARRSGKPVMIGEFHFGATDRGLPATGIQGVPTQAERGRAYRYYVEQGLARPEIVGLHYFQWNDQPVFGRHDGENYNIGFLDICHRPYPELTEAARRTHERVYRVAAGELEPFAERPRKAPQIFY